MTSNFAKYKKVFFLFIFFSTIGCFAQSDTSQWKFQIGFGFNNPIDDVKEDNFYTKYVNFPTINMGVQYMFKPQIGAKIDLGYNRAVSGNGSPEFKFNYSRVNAQFVYDLTYIMQFLPQQMAVVGHIGPGVSFTKPLGSYAENKYTYLNLLAGIEVHYGIARTVSVYGDFSYALGLTGKEKYDPETDGFSFNGDLMYVTVGISVSLSGCYYCE